MKMYRKHNSMTNTLKKERERDIIKIGRGLNKRERASERRKERRKRKIKSGKFTCVGSFLKKKKEWVK